MWELWYDAGNGWVRCEGAYPSKAAAADRASALGFRRWWLSRRPALAPTSEG